MGRCHTEIPAKEPRFKTYFFDDAGVFDDKPAFIYALHGTDRIFLGVFTGPTYKTYIDLLLQNPVLADAIIVHKFSNNIPQKVQVYGQPYTQGTTPLPQSRLYFQSATPSENTGQNYNQWLNDNLDSTIDWGNQNSFKYIDVLLKFPQRNLVSKFSFWDTEGEFSSNPAYFYALKIKGKDTVKTYLGIFTGPTYNTWVDLNLDAPVMADAILVHKYSRYIPQKINAYGEPILADPLDTIVPPDGRIKIVSLSASDSTGQDYSPLMNDNLDSLIQGNWTAANYIYTDITLKLEKKSKVGRLVFYNADKFTDHPALIYAKNDTIKTLIGQYTGTVYHDFITMTPVDSLIADAIEIHKYSNNLPNKIKVYGADYVAPVITDTNHYVKIPIDGKRWFQLNNVSNGLEALSDGVTEQWVETGWGKIFNNYDAYYPVNPGEEISLSSIKFYDWQSSSADQPFTMYAINSSGKKVQIAKFTGSQYGSWVGPYPDKNATGDALFKLDSVIKDIRYIVINCSWLFPSEIELYGTYKAGAVATPIVKKSIPLKNYFGVNAFEWDFLNPYNAMAIDESKYTAVKTFAGVRHYIDWEKLESTEGGYTFSPVHSGGWNYDTIYKRCKTDNIDVLACIKTLPNWLQQTYPDSVRDAECVPVRYGKDFSSPLSYIEQAKVAFQYAGRYGRNKNVKRP